MREYKKQKKSTHNKFTKTRPGYYDKNPIFCYKDFKKNTDFYTLEHSNSDKNCLYNFLNASRDFGNLTWEFILNNPRMFHCHEFLEEIRELNGIDLPLLQFKLPNHKQGRFIGYLDEKCIFNILLYDRMHQGDPRK